MNCYQSEPKPRPQSNQQSKGGLARCRYCGVWSAWQSQCNQCGAPLKPGATDALTWSNPTNNKGTQ